MDNISIILWNEASKKWQDVGNNFFCAETWTGKWEVRARYVFPDGTRIKEFETQHEAMEFFVNFLFTRAMSFVKRYGE